MVTLEEAHDIVMTLTVGCMAVAILHWLIPLFSLIWFKVKIISMGAPDDVKKIILDGRGYIHTDGNSVEVVKTLNKVPGLRYVHFESKSDGYGGYEDEYVIVTNEVGQAIELYINADGYAGMRLDEFLIKTLFNKVANRR